MNNYKVYKHTSPSGKVYIGITCQELRKRFMNGKGYKECPRMAGAIKKYGWDNFKHEVLFTGLTKEEAEAKEIELIKAYKSNMEEYGYNIENGGNVMKIYSSLTEAAKEINCSKSTIYTWVNKADNKEWNYG